MSVSGLALILFLTFHGCMNVVALFSKEAYNQICELLGSNWYAIVATCGLGALVAIHIIYAFILTAQNRKARGNNKYEITDKPAAVEWASQNMLVLGIIVLVGLLLHLYNFWWNMMAQELLPGGNTIFAADGVHWIRETFSQPIYVILYLIWLAALWFHLTHGFWSAIQTMGWNGKTWFCRWKVISIAYSTILFAGFAVVVLCFFARSLCGCC